MNRVYEFTGIGPHICRERETETETEKERRELGDCISSTNPLAIKD